MTTPKHKPAIPFWENKIFLRIRALAIAIGLLWAVYALCNGWQLSEVLGLAAIATEFCGFWILNRVGRLESENDSWLVRRKADYKLWEQDKDFHICREKGIAPTGNRPADNMHKIKAAIRNNEDVHAVSSNSTARQELAKAFDYEEYPVLTPVLTARSFFEKPENKELLPFFKELEAYYDKRSKIERERKVGYRFALVGFVLSFSAVILGY